LCVANRVFQSSPAPSGRCNEAVICAASALRGFQSSPAPSGRCNVGGGARPGMGRCFNPHRPLRAGATENGRGMPSDHHRFQSSPAPSGRCNEVVGIEH